ncbi:DUF4175 family protein [Larkinella rosea]|uniref:DUF4175 family protein n=1 Tax=Larkinella rosea TaxID=2025312 RepID=UPI001E43A320|nr:DUF4175 family protein [Larkinella rosea]
MQMQESIQTLLLRIEEYRKKFYINQVAKGAIFFIAFSLSVYLLMNTAEFFGRFSSPVRGILFFGSLAVMLTALYYWVINPLVHLYGIGKSLTNEEAAQQIGRFFPEVGDKLLNTLQLRALTRQQSDLLEASINQRSKQLLIVRFADAIQINQNRRFVKYAVIPAFIIGGLLLLYPAFLTSTSKRIISYDQEFAEEAPFQFQLRNKNLKAFRNEDYTLELQLKGNTLPQDVYLVSNNTRFKLNNDGKGTFSYTFDNVQRNIPFRFESVGFASPSYELVVLDRPGLLSFDVSLVYPGYLNKPSEQLSNVGNLLVPEGTQVTWRFSAANTDSVLIRFAGEPRGLVAEKQSSDEFEFSRVVKKSSNYSVSLKNKVAASRDNIQYTLNVVNDKFPQVSLENFKDTTFYNYVMLGGTITDDYGFSNLKVQYKVIRAGQDAPDKFLTRAIPFNRSAATQNFYYQWGLDSLKMQPGDRLEYFVQVWDNDVINGFKSARSTFAQFAVPDQAKLAEEAERSSQKTENQISKTLTKAQQLKKDLNTLENRLQTKKNLDFQDKKQAEDLLKKREELMQELKELQEQNKTSNERQQRFNNQNPEMLQKFEQLQKLMNELMDPETQKLYEELKKMLEQKQDDKMIDMLDRLKNKEKNLEKELERALELFKQLQMEQKMENAIKDLEKQAEKQEKLANETEKQEAQKDKDDKAQPKKDDAKSKKDEDAKSKKDENAQSKKDENQQSKKDEKDDKKDQNSDSKKDDNAKKDEKGELSKKQEELNKEFEKTREDLKDIEKMAEEMKNAEKQDTHEDLQQEISNEQQESQKQLDQKQNDKASKSQKNAAKQMKKLSEQLEQQQQSAEMEESQENMDDLRDILENLIQLSFDQERVMKDFKAVSLQDPRFVKLAQDQLKLQDDAKIIEDSLYALANRVLQIQTFVTRELNNMKGYMDESVKYIRERRLNVATSKQQFAMTSINNLALMLSDVFKQMQEQQMSQMSASGKGSKGKKKGKGKAMSMGEMQKQLNERMQKLMKEGQGGKGGRGMSEELSRLAAEQAMMRRMLKELQDAQKGTELGKKLGGEMNDIMNKMDETETDLVNKRVTQNTIKRQQEMLIRLLESEKAIKEQEEDLQRKAEQAKPVMRKPPPQYEQLVKDKQKQVELLRSVPPDFSPFYKREVDSYLKKLK